MGIKWFTGFLNNYSNSLLTKEDIHDQYVVIDGSELMFHLYADVEKNGRGNYVEYRENIKKFFAALQDCRIKPIILMDGFKFKNNTSFFIENLNKIIEETNKVVKGGRSNTVIKPYLCNTVFKQTIAELKIPCSSARQNSDEDIAALANVIDAPVLACDTVFCAYSLRKGFIPLESFNWKKPQIIEGQKIIRAQTFRLKDFVEKFQVNEEAVRFLQILFQTSNFEEFENFRKIIIQNVKKPSHFRSLRKQTYKNGWRIENSLIWFYGNKDRFTEEIIEEILQSLLHEADDEEVKERIRRDVQNKIAANLQMYKDPQTKGNFLCEIQNKIGDDSDCRDKLDVGIEKFKCNDDDEVNEDQVGFLNTLKQTIDHAGINAVLPQNQKEPVVVYLPLIPTNPKSESPHKASQSIRKALYSLLIPPSSDSLTIKEYDRFGRKYKETEPFKVIVDFIEPEEQDDYNIMEKRRSFLLKVLIEDEKHRDRFENDVNNDGFINDDLKLTLATTIYWIKQTRPYDEIVEAFVFLFTMLQLKQSDEEDQVEFLLKFIEEEEANKIQSQSKVSPMLHPSAQWEACMRQSTYFNEILEYPISIPTISNVFSGSILEQIYDFAGFEKAKIQERLEQINGAAELKRKIESILNNISLQ